MYLWKSTFKYKILNLTNILDILQADDLISALHIL